MEKTLPCIVARRLSGRDLGSGAQFDEIALDLGAAASHLHRVTTRIPGQDGAGLQLQTAALGGRPIEGEGGAVLGGLDPQRDTPLG